MSPETQPSSPAAASRPALTRPALTRPLQRLLAWTTAAALLCGHTPALASAPAAAETTDAEDSAPTPADPKLAEAVRYFQEGEQRIRQGQPVAAADLFIAAYELLDDPRKYRNQRGSAVAKIYVSLLTAYEAAETDNAKIDRACRLRNLMNSYLADLKSGYGEASEQFSEVHTARDKLRGLDLMIAAHGDPEALCDDSDDPPRKRVAMLGPASLGPASLPPQAEESAPVEPTNTEPSGPVDDTLDTELEPARDRKAIALTAVGGTAIGLGAASLGVMALYLSRGTRNRAEIQTIYDDLSMRDSDAKLTEEELTRVEGLNLDGKRFNTIAMATGISGGVAVLSGVILTAVGGKRLRSRQVSMAPNASMTSLGATLHLRF